MRYNGRRYAQLKGKHTGGILDNARKKIDGYHQRMKGGVFLYSLDFELFAFVNTEGERYVVGAWMEKGSVKFEAVASEATYARLGFDEFSYDAERTAINGIKFS